MMDLHAAPAERVEDDQPDVAPQRPGRGRLRRWVDRLVIVTVAVVSFVAGGFAALWLETPSVSSAPRRVAVILAAHDAPRDHGNIPVRVAAAVLATEDSRFYGDPALDPAGVGRALWGEVTDNPDEGGATIEMQLAKLLYTGGHSGFGDQVEQVVLAFKLDSRFTKTTILAMYLDAAYFGDGAYGVVDAAFHYFGVAPAELTWGQASLLAGLLQAPSAYNPARHLRAALRRRGEVLVRLRSVGALTSAQVAQISAEPLDFAIATSG
jgi:membrane peptidoglycan carboxypeptidase